MVRTLDSVVNSCDLVAAHRSVPWRCLKSNDLRARTLEHQPEWSETWGPVVKDEDRRSGVGRWFLGPQKVFCFILLRKRYQDLVLLNLTFHMLSLYIDVLLEKCLDFGTPVHPMNGHR